MGEVWKLTIKKSNIQALKQKCQWNGSGTQIDPLEITSVKNLPDYLIFKTKDIYIKISNIWRYKLKLTRCQNITIYNCSIKYFHLKFCWNVILKNCSIKEIRLENCKGNTFEHNKISNIENLTTHNPNYKLKNRVITFLTIGSIIWALTGFLIVIVTLNISRLFKITVSGLSFIIISFLIIGSTSILCLWEMVIPLKIIIRLRKLEPNKLNGNSFGSKGSGVEFPDLIKEI